MSQLDIDKMKLKELRAECKKRGLPVSGNKPVLIVRLKAGAGAIKRKASRKPRKKKSAKRKSSKRKAAKKSRKKKSVKKSSKKSRKRKSAKRKAVKKSRKRKSVKRKAVKKSRKRKSVKRKAVKRKPSTKKSRIQDWAEMTKAEISKELKSMKVTEIRKSPKLKPFLKGKSKAKKQELIVHLTDVLSSGQDPPAPKAKGKRKSAKKRSRKAVKKSSKKKAPKKSARKASTKVSRKASKKAGSKWNIKLTRKFTRGSVKKNRDSLFVFGENDECFPVGEKWRKDGEIDEDDENCYQTSTQAQIRGEPNAAPIVTISRQGASDKELKSMMKRDVGAILKDMNSGKYQDLVLSTQLVGTGVAQLPKKKPEVWKFLQEQLARLKSGGVLQRPSLGSDKTSITAFTAWMLDKEIRKRPQKVIPRKSRKTAKSVKSTKPSKPAKTLVPVPQDSNADIEKAIRKCLYGDTDILPSEAPEEPVPEIVDDEEKEEELEIVDDE